VFFWLEKDGAAKIGWKKTERVKLAGKRRNGKNWFFLGGICSVLSIFFKKDLAFLANVHY
jgi:uncharacterized membrane protein